MVDRIIRLFSLLDPLFARLGIDPEHFKALLWVKLTQDQRRKISGMQNRTGSGRSRGLKVILVVHIFLGLFLGLFTTGVDSPLVGLTLVNSVVMAMTGLMLMGDFSNVLMDTTDNIVLLPRPVSSRTLLATRIAHIVTYLGLLSLSLALGTLIIGTFTYHPLFAPTYLLCLILSLMLVVFGVYSLYFLLLKRLDIERFRDIVLYFQVAAAIFFFAGYQALPRIMDFSKLKSLSIQDAWWIYIMPPTWMAAPVDLLTGRIGLPQFVLLALAIVVPIACGIFVFKVLAPSFTRALSLMESDYRKAGKKRENWLWSDLWASLFARGPVERSSFAMLWAISSRDRTYKMAVYPGIGIMLILLPVLFAGESLDGLRSSTFNLFFFLYVPGVIPYAALESMRYSVQHEAAWIYHAHPLERPGELFSAAFKVVMVRFFLPIYSCAGLAVVLIWGMALTPDVLFAGLAASVASLLIMRWSGLFFPFSQEREIQGLTQFLGFLVGGICILVCGGIHLGLRGYQNGMFVAIPLILGLFLFTLGRLKRISWEYLKAKQRE